MASNNIHSTIHRHFFFFSNLEAVDCVVGRGDQMEGSQTIRGRGRSRKIIRETIRKDLKINELDRNMVFDRTLWHNLIYVADPT